MNLNTRSAFVAACFFSRVLLLVFLFTASIGLMPDEAQYWTWSQNLDIGYYSKPPAIAWQIAAGTSLFGATELGVRFIALLMPIASALVIRKIVLCLVDDHHASWCAATAFILSPMGFATSFLATTDAGMVLLALCSVWWYLVLFDRPSRYAAVGVCIAIGALWKWMIYSLWIVFAVELIWRRKHVLAFLGGIAISLFGLLPTVLWNYAHDWTTFRHVGATLACTHATIPNPVSFLLAGIALITPGFFLLALPSLGSKDQKVRLLSLIIGSIWLGLLAIACTRKVQGNWAVLAQAMFFPLVGVCLAQRPAWKQQPYTVAILVALLMQAVALTTPYFGAAALHLCPFKQGMGNNQIAGVLSEEGYTPGSAFLFSDRYQTTSQLWAYGPGQHKAYFFNLHGLRNNQFCYWPGMDAECVGKNGWFVSIIPIADKRSLKHRLKTFRRDLVPYFSHLSKPIVRPLLSPTGNAVRLMILIACQNYNGKKPQMSNKF